MQDVTNPVRHSFLLQVRYSCLPSLYMNHTSALQIAKLLWLRTSTSAQCRTAVRKIDYMGAFTLLTHNNILRIKQF